MFYKGSHHRLGAKVAEIVLNERTIEDGESYFAVYVDRTRGVGQSIVGELEMNLIGPVSAEIAQPRRLSGFELPALEMMHLAQQRAAEQGVKKILLIDPQGLLTLARINRYDRR
jgi:hypothetical protein